VQVICVNALALTWRANERNTFARTGESGMSNPPGPRPPVDMSGDDWVNEDLGDGMPTPVEKVYCGS